MNERPSIPLPTRQSERVSIPLQPSNGPIVLPSAPASGKATSPPKVRLVQDFIGGRPSFIETDGPLDTPCWLWLGATHPKGYAMRWIDGRRVTVHRELVGPLGADEEAHHVCEVRHCVNPAHIKTLTKSEHARRHRGGRTALDDALALLAQHPRLSPAAIADLSGQSRSAVSMALWRAERSGRVRRIAWGEYVLAEVAA